jgi:hypothetical protein
MIVPTGALHAQQGGKIQFGHLKIIPGLTGEASYDDNIYKKNGKAYAGAANSYKKVSDMIYHIKPSLLFNYSFPERGSLNLGWQMDYALYGTETGNNWANHRVPLDFNYMNPEGIILGLANTYSYSEDPYGNADQYKVGTLTKRWDDEFKVKAGYHLGASFRTIVDYAYYTQKYDKAQDRGQDYDSHTIGINAEARFLPKTWGFLRYAYVQKGYTQEIATLVAGGFVANGATKADSKSHVISVGMKWDPGAKLSGEFNVGYQMKKYDNEWTNTGGTRVKRDDSNTFVASTAVNFKPLEQTLLSLMFMRANRDAGTDTNENFDDTLIGIKAEQQFFTKFKVGAGLSYAWNDYNRAPVGRIAALPAKTDKRSDNNFTGNVFFDYQIQDWVGVGLSYDYMQKTSNYEENEYTDNKVTFAVKFVY